MSKLLNQPLISCSAGSIPTVLTSTHTGVQLGQAPIALETHAVPILNIMPFGTCGLTQKPCVPQTMAWTGCSPSIRVGGIPVLTENSCLNCAVGGKISVVLQEDHGVSTSDD